MSWDPNTELLEMYYEQGIDQGLSPKEAEIYAKEMFEKSL